MRTANNTNNNFSVKNLVEKYCTYVSPSESEIDFFIGAGVYGQLLVTLYSSVAGNEADHQVLSTLSIYAEKYQKDALEEEEFVFLCKHFREVVSYVFAFNGDILCRDVPYNTIEFVQEMAKPKDGQTIFLTNAEYGDMAALFPGCIVRGFTGSIFRPLRLILEVWAWGQIRLYALGIKSEIVPEIYNEEANNYTYTLPEKGSIDIVITNHRFKDIQQLYELLKEGGSMFWFAEKSEMAGNGYSNSFRKQLVREKSINTLVSFDEEEEREFVLIYIKRRAHKSVRIINDKEGKSAVIKAEELDSDILWPSYYLATRPSTGKPLSSIVKLPSDRRKRLADYVQGGNFLNDDSGVYVQHDVSDFPDLEYIPLVTYHDLGNSYKDANLMEKEVYTVADDVKSNKYHVELALGFLGLAKQPFIILSEDEDGRGLRIGYATQVGKNGYAYPLSDCVLYPQNGIDPRYAAALLFFPSVAEQIMTICEGEIRMLSLVLDKIIIPDHDEKERLAFLSEANYDALIASRQEMEKSFEEKFAAQKTEYINEVRMRKHDMGQYIFELGNIEDLIRFYIENRETEKDFCKQIETLLDAFRVSLGELSTMLDNLSKEEQFGTPEAFSIDRYLSQLEKRYKHDGFKITYNPDLSSFKKYNASRIGIKNNSDDERKAMMIPPSLFVATNDIQRAVNNIIDNARKHGFTNPQRTDYEIRVELSIDMKRNMFNIEFRNNGNPLPKGMDKIRYGIKGEKAGKNAGTGIGGNYIKQFVEHYKGDYDISMENEWTVVRICLPIK